MSLRLYFVVLLTFLPFQAGLADEVGQSPNKAISVSETVEGEESEWGGETESRREHLYPSNWGQVGLFRVRSAESLPWGSLSLGIGGEFYSVNNAPNFGTGSNANTIAESLFVGFSPLENLTIGVQRRNSSTTFGNPSQLISSLGDFTFSGMYSIALAKTITLAPIANVQIASNFNQLAPAGTTLSAGLGTALTVNLFPATGIPLAAHANVLYHMPQVRTSKRTGGVEPETFFNFSRYHTVTLGLGAELQLGDFIPFLEFYDTINTGSGVSFGRNPSKISIGTRITPLSNKGLAVLVGTDIGIGKGYTSGVPYSPDYQILGQLSYTVGLVNTERKHYYTTKDVNVVDRKFIINRNINFKTGSAQIDNSSFGLLDQIAEVILQNKVHKLMIVGHTDSSAADDYNLKLSQDRAVSVKRYLVNKGVTEEIFMTQGYGKRKPKASNLTESGRALNRRVEFFILE